MPSETWNQKDIPVLIAVQKDIQNKVVISNWANFINYWCYFIIDIKKLYPIYEKYAKKRRIINFYDNKIGEEYL